MNPKKYLENRIRGWLPEEPNVPNVEWMISPSAKKKLRLVAIIGISAVLVIGIFLLLVVVLLTLNPIVPTDVKIYNTLDENKIFLLNIDGVLGAGIARNSSNNHIIGIVVYVEDNMTNVQEIPKQLGEYTVFIKRISEVSEFEKERMFIRRQDSL